MKNIQLKKQQQQYLGSRSITLSIFHHLLQLGLKTNQSILSCLEIFLESSEYDLIRPLCCLGLVLGQGPLDLPWDAGLVRPQGPSGLGSVGSRGSRSVPRLDAWALVCQRAAWGSPPVQGGQWGCLPASLLGD